MKLTLATVIDMQLWYKTLLLNGINFMCVKQQLHRTQKEAGKSSWSRPGSQKSFTLTLPREFGKACEDLTWNHCTSTPRRSETSGIAVRSVRRHKEGTSAMLLQSGLNENWLADSMECYCYLRNIQDRFSDEEKNTSREAFW